MIPDALLDRLRGVTGESQFHARPCSGGSINHACRLDTAQARYLFKWHPNPPFDLFQREGEGLNLLRSCKALRIPSVIACIDLGPGQPAGLLLEWLEPEPLTDQAMQRLGSSLAEQHRAGSPNGNFGLANDNYIGSTPQINGWSSDWMSFFRENRLEYQARLASSRGYLPAKRRKHLAVLLSRLDRWIPTNPYPALVHGDLWSGNVLQSDHSTPCLIDPAVYYADREVDLAFTSLFGGFSPAFYAAYQEAWPVNPGYTERRDLYNLYHLLNHLNLFGESYGAAVDAVLDRYAN